MIDSGIIYQRRTSEDEEAGTEIYAFYDHETRFDAY